MAAATTKAAAAPPAAPPGRAVEHEAAPGGISPSSASFGADAVPRVSAKAESVSTRGAPPATANASAKRASNPAVVV
jgi:hypothetical protein